MISLLPKIFPRSDEDRRAHIEREFIRAQSEMGGKLFGPIPKGHKRQFFCLDEHTWIWHEEWTEKGQHKIVTTRYDIRPHGVFKTQDGQPTQRISPQEVRNLYKAAVHYYRNVNAAYQQMLAA